MNRFQRKVALRVLGIHVGVILFFLIVSSLKGCFRPKDKPEIVTFIEFGQAAPPVAVEQVQDMAEPEPPAPEPPAPTPDPTPPPEPTKVPEQPKKTIKPKVEKKDPVIKPKKEEPKWKPTKASDIDINKSKKVEPAKPAVDPAEISKALKNVQSNEKLPTTTAPGPVGNPDADAAYISQIGRFFDQRWNEPANASPASSVVYRIYISQWGTITKRTKIQGSGDSAFDASVAAAVNSVNTAPKPPSGFPYKYVEVEFRIRN